MRLAIFGKRAGEHAAAWARAQGYGRLDDGMADRGMRASLAPFDRGDAGENPYRLQRDLQDTMQALVGIVRTEPEMREALDRRGGHFREDCPDKSAEFGSVNIGVRQEAGTMRVTRVPIPEMPAELKRVIEEQKG